MSNGEHLPRKKRRRTETPRGSRRDVTSSTAHFGALLEPGGLRGADRAFIYPTLRAMSADQGFATLFGIAFLYAEDNSHRVDQMLLTRVAILALGAEPTVPSVGAARVRPP